MPERPRLDPADDAPRLPWRIRLLGDLVLDNGRTTLTRLPSQAAAALLARLALAPQRAHAREELVELLWPGVDRNIGRNRLRQVLSVVKTVLETDAGGTVLTADRRVVRVVPGALSCDAVDFEAACQQGRVEAARALYRGDLLPGFFDDWIADERLRLLALYDRLPPAAAVVAAPAPLDLPAIGGSAPAYLTRLFGREADRLRLRAEVLRCRLVTLTGPGGVGKTRLAAELAATLSAASWSQGAAADGHEAFDRVLFVPLVACRQRADVLAALATLLGTPAQLAALERVLSGQRVLLVLDNFEHLVDDAADIVQALLARLPLLHLLVTSRRVLALDGERECLLDPLPLPGDLALADAIVHPAVALFMDRAGTTRADLQIEPDNLASVLALVRALDGLPLALELAAARCRSLSPADMLRMIRGTAADEATASAASTLETLSRQGTRGDGDDRQASMQQVLQWSWQLLGAEAQALLSDLTVFRSGCSLAAVASVCGLGAAAAAVQIDALVAHSLLQVSRPRGSAGRYAMLEVIREFTAMRLDAARERQLRSRLLAWLIEWAQGEGPIPLPRRIEPELPNVHAALVGAHRDGAHQAAMQLALALRDYWELDGMPPLSQQALETALTEHGHEWPHPLRCDAHELLAYTSVGAGQGTRALAHADAALALAADDALRRGKCLLRRVWVCLAMDYQAQGQGEALDEALRLAEACDNAALQARSLHQQAILLRYQTHDLTAAEALFARAQALWEQQGNRLLAQARQRNRAQCWSAQGLHARALASFRQCEQAARAEGDWVGIIDSLLGMASQLDRLRQWDEALAAGRECIRVAWRRHHVHGLAYALWNIAVPMLRVGATAAAVRLMAFAATYWTRHMGPLGAQDQRDIRHLTRLARVRLDADEVERLGREGAAMSVAEAVATALQA